MNVVVQKRAGLEKVELERLVLRLQDLGVRVHLLGLNKTRLEARIVSFIQIHIILAENTSTDQVDEPARADLELKTKWGVWDD